MGRNVPAGADDDSRAPWNSHDSDPPELEYDKYDDMEDVDHETEEG